MDPCGAGGRCSSGWPGLPPFAHRVGCQRIKSSCGLVPRASSPRRSSYSGSPLGGISSGWDRLFLQLLGELQQRLRDLWARFQAIGSRSVIPLLKALQFQLQPQVLKVEFLCAFPLTQTFHLQIIRALTLLLGPLLLLISFRNQRTENRFQRFAILRKLSRSPLSSTSRVPPEANFSELIDE